MKKLDWYSLLEETVPLYRHICSPGMDRCLDILKKYFPEMVTHQYPTGKKCWTWVLPRKWNIKGGWIKRNGVKIVDFEKEPLCVMTGSKAINKEIGLEELKEHIFTDPAVPDLVPWEFKYFDETQWGFCISYHEYLKLFGEEADTSCFTYEVKIDSEFYDDLFSVGSFLLPGFSDNIITISSHICHPFQANDGLSGVAVAYLLYKHLRKRKNWYSYLFTFQPEFVGTVALLSHNEHLIERIKYGVFTEMVGTGGPIIIQRSFTGYSHIDNIAAQVLLERVHDRMAIKQFHEYGICNDEIALSMPGVRVPSIALNRGQYREYHTNGDSLDIIDPNLLEEAAAVLIEIIDRMEKLRPVSHEIERMDLTYYYRPSRYGERMRKKEDFIPIPLFKGPIFLAGNDLYVDWRKNYRLAIALSKVMVLMNEKNSCYDIAYACGLSFSELADFFHKLKEKDLAIFKKA